jgi:2-polyprenyl-3-methyl-5-hydroxy-6-metoxy-1,4-benzoquinol methylase
VSTRFSDHRGNRGSLRIEPLGDGRHRLSVLPTSGHSVRRRSWVTSYPLPLVHEIHAVKDLHVCDEIMREEDPDYVERMLRHAVLGYVAPEEFAGKRVLDFGCGSGASLLVLSRLLAAREIVGVELVARLVEIARRRVELLGRGSLHVLQSPSADSLPADLGEFDFIMFSAVFEHLLPDERPTVLPLIWRHLRPGGVMFLNQTPYRYWPLELHTTGGLPLVNYLPDSLAHRVARRFSRRMSADETWRSMLRRGIRGGTVPEILGILGGPAHAELLPPREPFGDRIDLWLQSLSRRHAGLKRAVWAALKLNKAVSGREITPTLSLAIRKLSA